MADGKDLMSTDIRDALFAVFFDNSILLFSYMSKNLLFYVKYPEMVISCLISQNTQDRAIENCLEKNNNNDKMTVVCSVYAYYISHTYPKICFKLLNTAGAPLLS